MTPSLSALIIAKDEEQDLPGCLESLRGLAAETIVVVDEATVDGTEALARAAGAQVLRRRFDDYARQRQASLYAATREWCLWIDADERVTPELAAEIRAALQRPGDAAGFLVPFEVRFLGRILRWGGLGGERHLRLFKRAAARFTGGALHEGVETSGPLGHLGGAMSHEPYRDLADYLSKLDRYTTLAAQKRLAAGRRAPPLHHLILPWEFFARAVLKLGFLDGAPGLVWAALAAFHSWLKYAKLEEMRKARRP